MLLRYLIAGGTAYITEMLSLYMLRNGLGLSPVKAVAITFWIGFFTSFVLQKTYTYRNFHNHKSALSRQLVYFSVLALWNYVFSLVLVSLVTPAVSVFIARTLAIACITLWNYVLYKKVFNQTQQAVQI